MPYFEVRTSEGGVAITNATFSHTFSNYGNGLYFVYVNYNTTVIVSAPGRNSRWVNVGYYSYWNVWLTKKVIHSKSHDSGGWT